jgi:UDP-GlcNAc:undecaprenyl-phosphate GlcNAc-1-phosphate transferase
VALGLPIMDTLLAMFRGAALGRNMFDADRDHIHHRLMSRLHLSHRDAVLVLYGLSMLFGATSLGLASANNVQGGLLLVAIASVVMMVMAKLGYFDLKAAQQAGVIRKRNLQLRQVSRRTVQAVERSTSLPDIWSELRPLAEELNAARFEFWYHGPRTPSGEREGLHYDLERDAGTALPVDLVVELKERELPPLGSLRVSWRDGRLEVDRDDELALELVAAAVTDTVMRTSIPPLPEKEQEAKVLPLRK